MLRLSRVGKTSRRGVVRAAAAIGLFAVTVSGPPADAAFTSLFLQRYATVQTATGVKSVYRVYAQFSDGADRLESWGGTLVSPTTLRTRRCSVQAGLPFYQARVGGNTAPIQQVIDVQPDAQWDTFATIGVSIANQGSGPAFPFDETVQGPGYPTFIAGNELILQSVVMVPAMSNQARADYLPDGDTPLRVLMMQLTVDQSDTVEGMIGWLSWRSAGGTLQTISNVQFNWQPAAAYGTCCLSDGCVNTFQVTCIQHGGIYMACNSCDQCTTPPCAGDIVENAVVDVNDLLAVISNWGPCPASCLFNPGSCAPDVSPIGSMSQQQGDCQVNVNDLLVVITTWGNCP